MKNKTVIIGGGISGLTAAIYLAKAGQKVTIYEKSSNLGGRAITTDKNGFKFNLGPHALYKGGEGVKILQELGISISGRLPEAKGYGYNKNKLSLLPVGLYSLFTTQLLSSFQAKIELGKLLTKLFTIDTEKIKDISLSEWLYQNIKNEEVRNLFQGLTRVWTYSCDTKNQNARAVIKQGQLALKENVYYLDNGWQSLIDSLTDKAIKAGVEIVRSCNAEKITNNTKDVTIHFSNNITVNADYVIVAASPQIASSLIDNKALKKYAEQAKPARAACLDLALKKLPNPDVTFIVGVDQNLYYSVHSNYANLTTDKEGVVLHVAKYLSENEDGHNAEKELEHLMDIAQPNWKNEILEKRFLPNMIVSNNIYPVNSTDRAKVEIPDLKNVYFCGDWVGNKGLLADASFSSAKEAAKLILANNLVLK